MVLSNREYKRIVNELKDGGHTHVSEARSTTGIFDLRHFVLLELNTLLEVDEENETVVSNEPVIVDECRAYSYEGAFEFFRPMIIECMEDFVDADRNSKAYISEMYDTQHPWVKLVVASINRDDQRGKITQEFYITKYSVYRDETTPICIYRRELM